MMNIRDEILQAPHGTFARLARETQLSRQTIYRALYGIKCGIRAARAIARAYGQPERWPEFFAEEPVSPDPPQDAAA